MSGFDSKAFLATLSTGPGVYRMLDAEAKVIYVGKARNLKKRVASYFSAKPQSTKTMSMVQQIASIEVTVAASEIEALLLEFNLIKRYRPRYNVSLRDDKSFPYIYLSSQHEFPRLSFYRGARNLPGKFFGPYPNAGSVRETLLLVQKLFRLRSCEDLMFANRTRPCLQFQIKRCSAPCVSEIDKASYAQDVSDAVKVLEGRNQELVGELATRMEHAAAELQFERAARLRDRIQAVKGIQASQSVSGKAGDVDVIGMAEEGGHFCVAIVFIRGGRNLGSTNFFPKPGIAESGELLNSFLAQYYLAREAPKEIMVDRPVDDVELLQTTLAQRAGHDVIIRSNARGQRARWLEMARTNATLGLKMRLSSAANLGAQLQDLAQVLNLPKVPERMECFDISHTMGEATVASCVVFGAEGPLKSHYRRFNIEGLAPGDDYGALRQAITRRYTRIKRGEVAPPDVLFIDGGASQLAIAMEVLKELDIGGLCVLGVAKGADRRPGQERLFLAGQELPTILPPNSPALHVIQRIRDEAHRFAITGHRQRRAKTRRESTLEAVPGLGPRKRRELLRQFGGLQGVARASAEDLAKVRGISPPLAELIFASLHPNH